MAGIIRFQRRKRTKVKLHGVWKELQGEYSGVSISMAHKSLGFAASHDGSRQSSNSFNAFFEHHSNSQKKMRTLGLSAINMTM
jgi:hypothetical protein